MRRILSFVFLLATVVIQVGAEELVQAESATYRVNNAVDVEESNVIRGLLKAKRACPKHYGFCRNSGRCCPLGGDCCADRQLL
jgi:hypothetical protein